ncbi:RNA polymerase sigma factor (TIGR02999 family) [Dokdonella fugitiva]|uniref:RNA polymerase sigma factor (TIGR02999 family) n=1 Tax=Dokdonella fugitiva TaxID=328517 RepID=A0A839F3X9_9GAMM|nr:ECF-type sigma factor [Dokdonella fugitiva]MBA8888248.1 RNA polymerase sigma factor (TIGR02999 family) [Dokdonella fugitiva]
MAQTDLTELLNRAQGGDASAREAAFAQIYADLKRIAAAELRRNPGATLNTTALVHEAYAKLAAHHAGALASRAHFFSLAARAMRQILVDQARSRLADKRGGREAHTGLDGAHEIADRRAEELLLVDEALDRLAEHDERAAKVVEWHFFGGFTFGEIAAELDLSERTVRSDWALARAVLARELGLGDAVLAGSGAGLRNA